MSETKLLELARLTAAAHEDMFAQCCSNPITNAWGGQVSVAKLNDAGALAKNILRDHADALSTPAVDGKGNRVPPEVWVTHWNTDMGYLHLNSVNDKPWDADYDAPVTKHASNTRYVPAALSSRSAEAGKPVVTANCCHCGRIIDTREVSEGGDAFGAEMSDGRWTCSFECNDAVLGLAAPVADIEPVSVPDGWQLVPKEPTEEMEFAAFSSGAIAGGNSPKRAYRAMLAAAPHPTKTEGEANA
ncbi:MULTISPECIES: hypothetical protein [unclassified Ensifer]|uniref:hypothetical protein n=1 Tax=unclassified Ensifer TaxID=2633371 RepID=UPI000813CC1D|nr:MULTISPECIES: hypothetical protein [unclassified Ensifer]OCP21997.1 hypothetical protein BC361_25875 [Ensifer sp. LC54]OCP23223.1 hypothetical protein BC363_24890 [Ensifer sp. LC384]